MKMTVKCKPLDKDRQLDHKNWFVWKDLWPCHLDWQGVGAYHRENGPKIGSTPEVAAEWRAGAVAVKAAMFMSVSDQFQSLVAEAATPKAAYEALEGKCVRTAQACQVAVRRELMDAKMSKDEDALQFVERCRSLWRQMCVGGSTMSEAEVVQQIIAQLIPSLREKLAHIITASSDKQTFVELEASVHGLEATFKYSSSRAQQASNGAFAMTYGGRGGGQRGRGRGRGFGGRGFGNRDANPSGARGSTGSKKYAPGCWECGALDHIKAECPLVRQQAQRGGISTAVASGPRAGFVALSATTRRWTDKLELIVDTGASQHFTSRKNLLVNTRKPDDPREYTLGNGETIKPILEGDMHLMDETGEALTLTGVQYVPGAPDIFSVKQALDSNPGAIFQTTKKASCFVVEGRRTLVAGADPESGIWMLPVFVLPTLQKAAGSAGVTAAQEAASATPQQTAEAGRAAVGVSEQPAASREAAAAELMHARLGHTSYDSMRQMVKGNMLDGMGCTMSGLEQAAAQPCEPCIKGKHAREPFPASKSSSTELLELVHTDVCGPYPTTLGGSRYFITFLDDYSGFCSVTTLATRAEVARAVKGTLRMWELQTGRRVRTVRHDNGGEYLSLGLRAWFSQRGVVQQTTVSYTPQQNGKAERLNRTLMEKVRSMLADSKLPRPLWGEALLTAAILRNLSPAGGRSVTPWELFYRKRPDARQLRVFGCAAWVQIPAEKRSSKLDPVSEPGVLVGYQPGSKGWRVLLEDGHIVVSRDVKFDETKRPGFELPEQVDIYSGSSSESGSDTDGEDSSDSDGGAASGGAAGGSAGANAPAGEGSFGAGGRYPTRARQPSQRAAATAAAAVDSKAAAQSDPATYEEAMARPDADQWHQAMVEELAAIASSGTYTLVDAPPGGKVLPCRWVFTIKRGADGRVQRYKARLVVKGFAQREGIDFSEVFAPTSKYASLRALLAVAAKERMILQQLDVKTAFLNGQLEEELYMQLPPGFEAGSSGSVWRLHRTLYGLRQAPRAWHKRLSEELGRHGIVPSQADPSLYTKQMADGSKAVLLVWVDDILYGSVSQQGVDMLKQVLMSSFSSRDLGEPKTFLNMSIMCDPAAGIITLSQEHAIKELLQQYGQADAKPKAVPISAGAVLKRAGDDSDLLDTQRFPFNALVGSLLYLASTTRPDLSFAVGALARHMAKPTAEHWSIAMGLLRYLKGTASMVLTFGSETGLIGYCDADYAGDVDTRRSTTAYVFLLHGGAISWTSRLQQTVAQSTVEAEYMAAAAAVKEALWVRTLLSDLGMSGEGAVQMYCDNQGAVQLLKHPIASQRSKHIDVMHHFARERVARGEVAFSYCSTGENAADILTKPLPEVKHMFCCMHMGMK